MKRRYKHYRGDERTITIPYHGLKTRVRYMWQGETRMVSFTHDSNGETQAAEAMCSLIDADDKTAMWWTP